MFEVFGSFYFVTFLGGREGFHDVPGASAIDCGLINAQNGGLRSGSDQFWTFRWSAGPKFQTFFENIDPIQPLRQKCSVENDPTPILWSSGVLSE